jgi:UDP-N-acetylglucosamine 2-epimerase (non-hydrolysing)
LRAGVATIIGGGGKRGREPEYWDGRAAERIAAHLSEWLNEYDKANR